MLQLGDKMDNSDESEDKGWKCPICRKLCCCTLQTCCKSHRSLLFNNNTLLVSDFEAGTVKLIGIADAEQSCLQEGTVRYRSIDCRALVAIMQRADA